MTLEEVLWLQFDRWGAVCQENIDAFTVTLTKYWSNSNLAPSAAPRIARIRVRVNLFKWEQS
jgi:hypothetical protein